LEGFGGIAERRGDERFGFRGRVRYAKCARMRTTCSCAICLGEFESKKKEMEY